MEWDRTISVADITGIISILAVCLSLVAVARSNRKLVQSMRLSTLQAMVSELNNLRQNRSQHPDLERSLFEGRKDWSDLEIQHNLTAVQLANVFEWAFVARRDGLLDKDVWESWVETWRSVILASESLRLAFTLSVWTFGRAPEISVELTKLVNGSGVILDPFKKSSTFWQRLTGA